MIWTVLGLSISVAVLAGLVYFLFNILQKQIKEELKSSQDSFLQLARQQFESEQNKAKVELETRKQAVESSVTGLKEELEKYQKLMRDFEQDRMRKYGNLENELKNVTKTTLGLQDTTNRLNNILSNVKIRGQWGERMAEDIINNAGLIEGVNYSKQTKMTASSSIPDFTFFLPNDHKVNMDVKFPLDNYLKMVNAQTPNEKDQFEKEFVLNVRARIREIRDRGYVNSQENTLDFVLLFIPNEQVYGLIQEKIPGLMDEALSQKVVLCSPFTLYAMLSVIRQAFENFRFEKDIQSILKLIEQFSKYFETFKVRFERIGKSIGDLEATYGDVKDNDFKKLDTKIRHIDNYKRGKGITFEGVSEEIAIDADEKPAETNIKVL